MIRRFSLALLATLFLAGLFPATLVAGTFIWTGVSATGWQGNVTPPFDGTDDLLLPKAINNTINLSSDTFINSISLTSSDDYLFQACSPVLLTINNNAGNGIFNLSGVNFSRLAFDQNINLAGTGTLKMDAGNGQIIVSGSIVGTADLVLSNSNGGTMGAFIFNSTWPGNTYSGDTYITGIAATPVTVAFWNSQPFGDGTGTVYVQNGADLIAHGSQRIDNDIVFNTTVANDPIYLRSWDAELCFDGDVTLANDTTLVALRTPTGVPSRDNTGVFPTPGPLNRNVIDFEEDIDESGGARTLTVNGPGIILLEGSNSYTGGTIVNGSLIFNSAVSAPSTGQITANPSGYVGFVDTTPGEFANFLLNNVDHASSGAVGIDTYPGNSTVTFTDDIDLSIFTNPNIRLGTATSVYLTGNITPQGASYRFGNGGGTLYVQSDLVGGRAVLMNNTSVVPLTLYLQGGNNTYTGGTIVNNGFVIFDSDGALPMVGLLTASGAGNSYIGYTDQAYISAATFLGQFNKPATNGIIGFDTNATTLWQNGPFTFTDDIDLSTFNNGVYLGTATGAVLSGNLTPTADHILRLTAAQGSMLQVNSTLADPGVGPPLALSIGSPAGTDSIYSSGTVFLPFANSYTGGTTINTTSGGITLEVGDSASLGGVGGGPLTLVPGAIAGLQSSNSGVNLPNNIVFGTGSSLYVTGSYDLQLSGQLSGAGSLMAYQPEEDPTLTLSGNNSAFTGDISLYNFTLAIDNNNAAGTGTLRLLNSGSEIDFTANALNPVIYGLQGVDGSITLYNANALTIDMSNSLNDHEFGGTFDDGGSGASITVTSTTGGDALYLYGNNNYSGGTFVGTGNTDRAALALGNDNALGSGPVTLNTSLQGALAVNVGVTMSNDLIYIGGTLQGFGTFAPASVNSVANGPIIFDTGKAAVPGVFGLGSHSTPGTLTLATGADFANGGAMLWSIQDAARTDGFSTVVVDGTTGGNLNISATGGQFQIFLASLDSTGAPGFASNLSFGVNNTFRIATTTGGALITWDGNQGDFTFNTSLFADTLSSVYLTQVGNDLFINFTPVPEPSTYALLGLGLSAMVLPVLRRRKRV